MKKGKANSIEKTSPVFEKLEQLRALEFGYRIKVVLTAHDSVEVDTREELSRVEELINGNG